jgi:tol-pal system protein YbgF
MPGETTMRLLYLPIVLLAFPTLSFAENKEIRELQRDIALLQDSVRNLQSSFDQKTAALTVLVQQALDNVNKANTSIAVMQQKLNDQEKQVATPVLGLGQKVDSMAEQFAAVSENVRDLTSRMGKVQAQLQDTLNTIKTLQAPPPAPTAAPGASSGPPAGMTADATYNNARRDLSAGNLDLASQGFTDYLKYYGNTDLAPNAQFYVGTILYQKQDFESAVKAFDLVLENYSDNNKTPDAQYMKGMALLKMDQRMAASKEFKAVVQKYPSSEVAASARRELKKLGVAAPAASSKSTRRKR